MFKPDTTLDVSYDVYKLKIYRVKPRKCSEKGIHKNGNLLLFHGTNHESTVGILEKGFKPSTMGMYGRGVYLTERSYTATGYSINKNGDMEKIYKVGDFTKCGGKMELELTKENFVFVNEILSSTKLKDISVPKPSRVVKTDLKREHYFEKYTVNITV